MPFAATWMDLEIIILISEVSQRQIYYITCMCNLKYKLTYLENRKRFADIENKFMFTKGEREWGKG